MWYSYFVRDEDTILDPIQVLKVQQHGFVPNLDMRLLVKIGFEDMVMDVFSVEESTTMSIS